MSSHLFTYAVGDIHGDHALLTTLLDRIHDHADGEDYRLVFLGNAIDHGPNGAAVLSALRAMELRAPDRVVSLRGWHEAMMAEAEHDREALALWLRHGGDATLRSFGATRLQEVPREVVDWVARRPAEWRDALRRYVGGPELAADDLTPGLHVVHGALPVRPTGDRLLPEVRPGTTCIDTGAGFGGPLTAAIFTDLQAEPVGFLQAQEDGRCLFVPPRLPPPLGRDPRIALRHADGEPETAADWAIRQDSELLEAKLAAKRRQVRRRQLLATAAGLVLLVGGSAVLLKPALHLVSAPQQARWPLSGEPGTEQARRSDVASLTPQVPAASPSPERSLLQTEKSGPAQSGPASSHPVTPDSDAPPAPAGGSASGPSSASPPKQTDAAATPVETPTAALPPAPLPDAAPQQAADAGPQRAHALPSLPEQDWALATKPATADAPSTTDSKATDAPTAMAQSAEAKPDDARTAETRPAEPTPNTPALSTPGLMAHALPTPDVTPVPTIEESTSATPDGSTKPAVTADASPTKPADGAPAAAADAASPAASSSDAAQEVADARAPTHEPPLAPLLPPRTEALPEPPPAPTPQSARQADAAAPAEEAGRVVETAAGAAARADEPLGVASAGPQATPLTSSSMPDLAPHPAAAPEASVAATTSDPDATASFTKSGEVPSRPTAPGASEPPQPIAPEIVAALATPATPEAAETAAQDRAALAQPPMFTIATSFSLASDASGWLGWGGMSSPVGEGHNLAGPPFAALPALSTPELLDDAPPPFVASLPPAASAPHAAPPPHAASAPHGVSSPHAVAKPRAKPAPVAAIRRPAPRAAPAQAQAPAAATAQAGGPIDLRAQQPKSGVPRGRLFGPTPASGELY